MVPIRGARHVARWVVGLLAVALSGPGPAIDLGPLGKAREAISTTQDAVSTGKELLSTGREAVTGARQLLDNGGTALKVPGGAPTASRDEGGTRRVLATLEGDPGANPGHGGTVISLRDQGPYFAQRLSAFVAPASAQWLATPRADNTTVSINLDPVPEGAVFDFGSGRARSASRGVKIFTLSVHANLPQRSDRRALDAIEQHGMLHASSVQLEWPREASDILEPASGQLLVWASDTGVVFPRGFGADGKLFTEDDPLISLSRGYTVVTLDKRGFSFDRRREVALSLHPVRAAPDIDLSRLGYAEAFQAVIRLLSERYPYSDARPVNWAAYQVDTLARVQAAQKGHDTQAYAQVFGDIGQRLRDGQFRVYLPNGELFRPGAGLADLGLSSQPRLRGGASIPMPRVWLLDDGRGMVSDVANPSPAAHSGLRAGAQIIEIAGEPLRRYLERDAALSLFATESSRRLDALALGTSAADSVLIKVHQDGAERTLQLGRGRSEAPVPTRATVDPAPSAFQLRSVSGKSYGYIALGSFAEVDANLELWERSLASVNRAGLAGLILDLRGNRGDSVQLVAHMLASFFSYDQPLRSQDDTQRQFDTVSRVWRSRGGLGLPPQLPLYASGQAHYPGKLIVLTGRDCGGSCQLFSARLQRAGRAQVVATEPTAGGAVGHSVRVSLPDGLVVRVPVLAEIGRAGENYLDGQGVRPDLRVPVDLEFVQRVSSGGDPVLDAAVQRMDQIQSHR